MIDYRYYIAGWGSILFATQVEETWIRAIIIVTALGCFIYDMVQRQ